MSPLIAFGARQHNLGPGRHPTDCAGLAGPTKPQFLCPGDDLLQLRRAFRAEAVRVEPGAAQSTLQEAPRGPQRPLADQAGLWIPWHFPLPFGWEEVPVDGVQLAPLGEVIVVVEEEMTPRGLVEALD